MQNEAREAATGNDVGYTSSSSRPSTGESTRPCSPLSRSGSRPSSGDGARANANSQRFAAAALSQRVPPKAPSSAETARRLLHNSTLCPLKRFDSADYFMNLELEAKSNATQAAAMQAAREASRADEETATVPPPPALQARPLNQQP